MIFPRAWGRRTQDACDPRNGEPAHAECVRSQEWRAGAHRMRAIPGMASRRTQDACDPRNGEPAHAECVRSQEGEDRARRMRCSPKVVFRCRFAIPGGQSTMVSETTCFSDGIYHA